MPPLAIDVKVAASAGLVSSVSLAALPALLQRSRK